MYVSESVVKFFDALRFGLGINGPQYVAKFRIFTRVSVQYVIRTVSRDDAHVPLPTFDHEVHDAKGHVTYDVVLFFGKIFDVGIARRVARFDANHVLNDPGQTFVRRFFP
jgi:hypothetical protein